MTGRFLTDATFFCSLAAYLTSMVAFIAGSHDLAIYLMLAGIWLRMPLERN